MPKFEVEQYELHVIKYRIEAENEAQAVKKVFDGVALPVDNSLEYIEVADDYGLPVDEHRELADQLRALGVSGGEAVSRLENPAGVEFPAVYWDRIPRRSRLAGAEVRCPIARRSWACRNGRTSAS
jgi:hypothetical protein